MDQLAQNESGQPAVWVLIRDIGLLQVKLLIDGFRDLILVPASLIAGAVSLARTKNGKPGSEFYELISVGRESERWINLFGATRNAPGELVERNRFGETDIDELLSKVEGFVVDEYQRGGVTAQAKTRLDRVLEAMRRRRKDRQL